MVPSGAVQPSRFVLWNGLPFSCWLVVLFTDPSCPCISTKQCECDLWHAVNCRVMFCVFLVSADAPMIISPEAANVSLSAGDSYVLNCTATGMPVPQVSWRTEGEKLAQSVCV